MYKACIFDLDGTVADTVESIAHVANQVLDHFGLAAQPVEAYKYFAGDGGDMLMERCFAAAKGDRSNLAEAQQMYRDVFAADPLYRVKPFPGIVDMLKEMKERGMKLAVLSNKPHEAAVPAIEGLFGKELFDEVQGQQPGIPRKPSPIGALALAEKFGVKPGECLYVGDTNTDMQTGKAAGMYTVGVLWGFRERKELEEAGADCVSARPGQLLGIAAAPRIRLVVSDLDGTLLLNGSQQLPEETCGQIRRLLDQGICFAAASGRQYPNLRRLFAPVADEISYICENGCLVMDGGEKIYKAHMDRETGQDILRAILERESAEALLSGEDTSYIQPKEEAYLHHVRDEVENNVTVVDDLLQTQEDYFKISVFEKDGIAVSEDYWKRRFSSRVTVVTSGNEWLDMMPKGVNKGTALKLLLEHLGIAPEECVIFGDNYNDAEMLAMAGWAFAMDTAVPGIRRDCPWHTDTVGHALEEILRTGVPVSCRSSESAEGGCEEK